MLQANARQAEAVRALPRRLWPEWGRRIAQVVEPGGVLAGYFFFDNNERGPPFGLPGQEHLAELLGPHFERVEDCEVGDSIDVFKGKERWQVWKRR